MTSQDQDARQLQEILGEFYAGRIDRNAVRSAVMDVILARIGCQRVSMWKFEGAPGRLNLLCFASKTAGGELDTSERRLAQSQYRDYFNALIERGTYVSSDAIARPGAAGDARDLPRPQQRALAARRRIHAQRPGLRHGLLRGDRRTRATGASATCWRCAPSSPGLALMMSGAPESVLWTTPSLPAQALADGAPPAPADQRAAARKG